MRMPANLKTLALPLFVWLAFFAVDAHAAIDNAGVFDSVLDRYQAAASGWAGVITTAATWLFWTLVVISMVWTFGMMALRKADIGEFFAEFVRFTIFTGFFWWALTNGPNFASSIYASLRQLAGNATGLGNALSPSGIVDVGFAIFDKVMDQSSVWSPVDSMAGILMAVAILVILALVGVNMLLLLASGWVLAYGGVFFLGFGGSRWTSDMAINYYKVVLGVAAQLFAMVLLVGIGKTFLDDYYSRMSAGISLKEMGVMLIVVIILLALVNKIPPLIAGIITGASVGGAGIGQFGAGAALGAAGMAAAAAATGGAALAAGAASAAGGASAVMAAFSKANENVSAGTDVMSAFSGGGSSGGGSGGGGGDAGTGGTPFAQAAGFSGGSGGGSSSGGGSTSTGSSSGGSKGGDKGGDKGGAGGQGSGSTASTGSSADKAAKNEPKPAGGAGQGQQAAPGSTGPGLLASAASALGTAGRIAADAGANLAKGTADVAKAKAASLREAAAERIADTTGGKIAAAIKAQGSGTAENIDVPDQQPAPSFGDNSLAGGPADADPESEVAAFANREQGRDGTTA
ncbi:P-type conjugative transfer protein TrbL (plasmid) [Pseudomonas sp. JS3066]|uniref:P-type conjugative transfer protein TrbL n=1 Tax=Pseudomonas sp. JS3066 TaxID=3090665 RepID=UPI002E7AF215|nr:P-type conjugative transfer protein TrbL [Pseudomonas sp. JS3066]WVK96452.1 P-type conjugative transfer protein TrbL [Pseudomonas sp. JS3066]